jgi:hypothetical protein
VVCDFNQDELAGLYRAWSAWQQQQRRMLFPLRRETGKPRLSKYILLEMDRKCALVRIMKRIRQNLDEILVS